MMGALIEEVVNRNLLSRRLWSCPKYKCWNKQKNSEKGDPFEHILFSLTDDLLHSETMRTFKVS